VPGEYRANLRRIIVTQGDTEPASVEQQRHLGLTCAEPVRPAQPVPGQRRGRPPPVGHGLPAAQALRPRRPRRGRGAARAPQRPREDNPRILQAFNEQTPDWLSFFMFTYFTDRDGKFQLCALAESASIRWRARPSSC
jgi:benzoyl-CoA 2,3-dioxygenase component B